MPGELKRKRLSAFAGDRSASVSITSAVAFVALFGMAALAIDTSAYFVLKRRLQSVADLSSMAAAVDIANARPAALATLAGNGFDAAVLETIETGVYTANPAVAPANRFVPGIAGAQAVRVTLRIAAPRFFGRIFTLAVPNAIAASDPGVPRVDDGVTIRARAVAASTPAAAFAVGSRLLQLDGGILNGVLGGLLGANLSLSAMDYQALASANVDLFAFSAALASRLSLTAASYSDIANANVRTADVLRAAADVVGAANGNASASSALARLASAVPGSAVMAVSSLVSFGPAGARRAGGTPMPFTVTALDLVSATATLANGRNQVRVDLASGLPGIASASLQLVVGDHPAGTSFAAVGQVGAVATTAQTRLLLTVSLTGVPPVPVLSVPIYIDLASATAKLSALSCAGGVNSATATLMVTPSVADSWIGAIASSDFANLGTPASPASATLATAAGSVAVSGRSHATVANLAPVPVSFSAAEIAAVTKKTVSSADNTAALFSSLLGNLRISAVATGLGVNAPNIESIVAGILANAAAPLDQILNQVLTALGIGIGQADTWVTGARCNQPTLVY